MYNRDENIRKDFLEMIMSKRRRILKLTDKIVN